MLIPVPPQLVQFIRRFVLGNPAQNSSFPLPLQWGHGPVGVGVGDGSVVGCDDIGKFFKLPHFMELAQ